MASLLIEGDKLGEKHRHFNSLVEAANANPDLVVEYVDTEDTDLNNFMKIDIACKRRNVQYILDVFTCNEILYVTRAINNSTWLITENQYATVINPHYLHQQLFPKMTSKGKIKLSKAIRVNLKDESRVEEFFNFYEDDFNTAKLWLNNCSVSFIENIVQKHANRISRSRLKRLCQKSFEILNIYMRSGSYYHPPELLEDTMFLLNKHTTEILDIVQSYEKHLRPNFGKRQTKIIMKNCPQRIIENFEEFYRSIDIATFASCMKKEEISCFLLKQNQNQKLKGWLNFENTKLFIRHLPKQVRLKVVKSLSFEKNNDLKCSELLSSPRAMSVASNDHIYRWYAWFAPFDTAFVELKKLIQIESSAKERNAIMTALIKCAGSNKEHIHTLLEFYNDNHINESFKYKVQFTNSLITLTETHRYDESTWILLDNIFISMEVYIDSNKKVPFCIQAILVRKLMHDEEVPEIILKKFLFNTLKQYIKKLNKAEQDKLFSYLYRHLVERINKQKTTNESDVDVILDIIQKVLDLLTDWHKTVTDFPEILNKIKDVVKTVRHNCWSNNLSWIYNKRYLRKHLFEESFILHPSNEACVNALKHDPSLLISCRNEVETLFSDDNKNLTQTLRKLRVYEYHTIRQIWLQIYLARVFETKGQKSVIKAICTLMPQNEILEIIKQNAPIEKRIVWTDKGEEKVHLRKNIAKLMYLVRPQINLDIMLLYATGDYLYYALPSIIAMLYNVPPTKSLNLVMKVIELPISLQKHALRLAFRNLSLSNIVDVNKQIWKRTKCTMIKIISINETFTLLCKEKNLQAIQTILDLLSFYIDTLTSRENVSVYNTLCKCVEKVESVPIQVRGLFFAKVYLFLTNLQQTANFDCGKDELDFRAAEFLDLLQDEFVEDVLIKPYLNKVQQVTSHKDYHEGNVYIFFKLISAYILRSKTEELQMSKYNKILNPVLDNFIISWKNIQERNNFVEKMISEFLYKVVDDIKKVSVENGFVVPVKLLQEIQNKFVNALPIKENYKFLMVLKYSVLFVEKIDEYLKSDASIKLQQSNGNNKWNNIRNSVGSLFGEACSLLLRKDSLLSQHFALNKFMIDVFLIIFNMMHFDEIEIANIIRSMLADKNASLVYVIVVSIISSMRLAPKDPIIDEIYNIIQENTSPVVKILWFDYINSIHNFNDE